MAALGRQLADLKFTKTNGKIFAYPHDQDEIAQKKVVFFLHIPFANLITWSLILAQRREREKLERISFRLLQLPDFTCEMQLEFRSKMCVQLFWRSKPLSFSRKIHAEYSTTLHIGWTHQQLSKWDKTRNTRIRRPAIAFHLKTKKLLV